MREAVRQVPIVDLHTHLFPPSHGSLCHWGVDRLLTYHYLIAEMFMVLPPSQLTHEQFYALPLAAQADLVWKTLFVERSPLSEACRGVLTTWCALGLEREVQARDLGAIRRWYSQLSATELQQRVFAAARVRYVIMTNIPFDREEAHPWLAGDRVLPPSFRAALRVDALLKPDWAAVVAALRTEGYPETAEGLQQYLDDWVRRMQPVYLMASLPSGFQYPSASGAGAELQWGVSDGATLLHTVLIPLARRHRLGLALKLGAVRAVVPSLRTAGDGIETVDVSVLGRICSAYPDVKFLATFLSRSNQHEACVLAQKMNNLHLYGCWWYCNIPSIIREITAMRVELLGTAFTAQHSDCRVLDQLVYKWQHSREVIADVLVDMYAKLSQSWRVTRAQIDRDVERLFGGAFEEFLARP